MTKRPALRRTAFAAIAMLLFAAGALSVADYRANRSVVVLHSALPNSTDTGEVTLLKRLARGEHADVVDLAPAIAFVDGGNDCADFRAITLLRALYAHEAQFTPAARVALRRLFTGMRYWMDQPGSNAMVYWSENHQLLFAASEFLAGQHYPNERFADGRTGTAHRDAARQRILFWLAQRWRFGFSEWNSHYYSEDIAPLANLIDFANDDAVRKPAEIVLDLLLFDVAVQTIHGEFVATSGRLYENNMKHGDAALRRVVRWAFYGAWSDPNGIEINFLESGYRAPPVLAAIARDSGDAGIRTSAGRDLAELDDDASISSEERRIMAQWGMEAFSNPRAIGPTLAYVREHGMFSNPYFTALLPLNYRLLRLPGVLPTISRLLDIPTNGLALQRANVYTYRSADFAMSTTVAYQPGTFGNQQHVFNVTLDPGVTLFHGHPAVLPHDPPPYGNSPGYWTGNGRLPLSCQDGPANISIYDIPEAPGMGGRYSLAFTHLYAPLAKFDVVALDGRTLFLRYRNALIAVTGSKPLSRTGADEVVQQGRETIWVTQASSTRRESIEAFEARVRNGVTFDGHAVAVRTGGHSFAASFQGGCTIDGKPLAVQFPRHESRYARTPRDPGTMLIAFAGHTLALDFARMGRVSH